MMTKFSSSHGVINPTKQVTNVGRRQNPTFIKLCMRGGGQVESEKRLQGQAPNFNRLEGRTVGVAFFYYLFC